MMSQPPSSGAAPDSGNRGSVAIVGMSCLFAGAPDLDTYWRNIVNKVDSVTDPPASEWDPRVFYDPKSRTNDRVYCKKGGYIGDLASFRPLDFGVMPVTVDGGEPDQWLALRVAQEALADAGYHDSPSEHMRTEVILGKGAYVNRGNLTVGYHGLIVEYVLQLLRTLHPEYTDAEIESIKSELKAGLPPFSADTASALIGNIIAGRIANRLDLMGPSYTVDAACASALAAVEIGVHNLLSRKSDLVLAGGSNVNAPLPTLSLFCQLGALSRQERIRPFDASADGTILGEGLGMIVLKRREDAERDGNRIYALIKGVGLASDGRALHVMAPRVEGEELALRRAYEMAGFDPGSVGLIEAHGTATPVGDVTEVEALSRVLGGRAGLLPSCALGSVKSNIGHTMPAAGIAGIIKTALSLFHRILPPTLNCDEPNPALHLERTPLYVNTEVRPWVHGGAAPRRAGVNSFGFGGINAHVVLEEHPAEDPASRSHLLDWDTEVCILEADTRLELIERVAAAARSLAAASDVIRLKDLAFTWNTSLAGKPARLAIVAASVSELAQRLEAARTRLADPKCRQIKDSAGTFFFDQPLGGKLAFLFPGEGAQYRNMLLDLCLHFPEVRKCFDLADRALRDGTRQIVPSEFIFPRSILTATEQELADKSLWQIDGAVESVLIANRAIWTLLGRLQIRPDVICGHSTGDYSAMLASNIIRVSEEGYVETILAWNRAHARLSAEAPVPEAVLIAVAAESAVVESIVAEVGGDLSVAMNNCPHQNVLVGSKEYADKALALLRSRGVIYELLPFDRPYHTPLFEQYAVGAEREFFSRLDLGAPAVETYSCTSAARYPSDVAEIRQLFIDHWMKPVLFTKTVQAMWDDGVRIFVEAGPRGNLTAFIGDILRGKPHLAMPANLPRRTGVTQINHLVGALAALGVPMKLDYLYARRDPHRVDPDTARADAGKGRGVELKLKLGLPSLTVTPRPRPSANGVAKSEAPAAPALASAPAATARNGHAETFTPAFAAAMAPARPIAARPPVPPAAAALAAPAAAKAKVMQDYLRGMEAFLEVEGKVVEAYLTRQSNGGAANTAQASFPLLGAVTELVPGNRLTAVRQLSLDEDIYLRDHALGGAMSVTDPSRRALAVVPLTMSMEILAEAAAALMPGKVLVEMRQLQATQWIKAGETPVSLEISANCLAEPGAVTVQIRLGSSAQPIVRATVHFADAYPERPARSVGTVLREERPSRWAGANIYESRVMFHGPSFQGVAEMQRCGTNGATARLCVLPTAGLLRSDANPRFTLDPVVLDAAGQVVGCWTAEYLERGFVVFPYQLDSLRVYGPNRPAGEQLQCGLEIELVGNELTRSDLEISDHSGAVWMQLRGWADRRFDPPSRFHRAWTDPQGASLAEPWPALLAGFGSRERLECYRCEPLSGFWRELAEAMVLTPNERRVMDELRGPDRRKHEWLAARIAAKDAVRAYLKKHHSLQLLPADIEIGRDALGRPVVQGSWTASAPAPELSIAHSGDLAVALVGAANDRRYGVDVQRLSDLKPGFESLAYNEGERVLLPAAAGQGAAAWIFRGWAAKEAVSKALGHGLLEGPASVCLTSVDPATGVVRAMPRGKLAQAAPEAANRELTAYTVCEGDYVAAAVIHEKGITQNA